MTTIKKTDEYITFMLDKEEYAIEVSGIESILEYTSITRLPGTDDSMKGVINLRGRALPVIDLKSTLGIGETEITQDTSIIVMHIEREGRIVAIGGLVDSVKEVLEILSEEIQEAPKTGIRIDNDCLSGIAGKKGNFIIILNISKIFGNDKLSWLDDELPDMKEEEE